MSQSRFSIVLVGVSALLRRPLVSQLRPADGERSSWVFFAARVGRFDSGFRSAVGLRVHRFRFSARAASELPLGELAFGLTASAFRHAPLRKLPSAGWFFRWAGWSSGSFLPLFGPHRFGVALGGLAFGFTASAFRHAPLRRLPSAGWPSGSPLLLFGMYRFGDCPRRVDSSAQRVGLRVHRFRFSACTASELPFGRLVLPLGGLAFGFTASAFRHAPLRDCPRRVDLRTPDFRFSVCAASGLPLGGLAFGLTTSAFRHAPFRRLPLGGLAFGLTASAFRHAPLRGCRWAGWPSGSRLPLFGTHRSAPPHRRREGRRSTPTRHLFHFKTLIPTC